MLWWVVDHAGLLYFLLGVALLALAAAWWLNRERKYLIALGVPAGLLVLVWLLTLVIVTDRQQLRRNIEDMAQAVNDNRPANIVRHLARDFSYQGVTRESAEAAIGNAIRDSGVTFVQVWNFDVEELSRPEGKARIAFLTRADLRGGQATAPLWCRADFVLEDGQWRLKGFNFYNGFVNTDQPIQIPLR
jgi:hypothetical protein